MVKNFEDLQQVGKENVEVAMKSAESANNNLRIYSAPLSRREVSLLAEWERERRVILDMLARTNWSQTEAADHGRAQLARRAEL